MEKKQLLDWFFIGWYLGSIIYAVILMFFDWNGPRTVMTPYYIEIVWLYLFEAIYISLWFIVILMIRGLKWQLADWNLEEHKIFHFTFIICSLFMFLTTGALVFLLPRTWPGMLIRRIFAYISWTFCGFLVMYIYLSILNHSR
ncbi:MAG: hypothetical protein ACTSR3_02360 [Candidatus Helarchaeota archaeon]